MGTTKTTNTNSNSSTTPTFTGAQSGLQNLLAGVLGTNLTSGGLTPQLQTEEAGSIGNVNNNYAGLSQQLQTSLAGRGFANSGKLATGERNLDVSRINDIGTTQSAYAGLAQQQQNFTLQQAMQFGFADPGSNSNSSSTQTQTTSGLGTVLGPLLQAGGLAFGLATLGAGGLPLSAMSGGSDGAASAGYGDPGIA